MAALANQAKSVFHEAIFRIDLTSADILEIVCVLLVGLDWYYGDAAAAVGTERFTEFTKEEPDINAYINTRIHEERFRKSVKDGMRKTVEQGHDVESLSKIMDGRIDRFVRERANASMLVNAKSVGKRKHKSGRYHDPDPGIWWAYVPGPNACEFCVMQGSRGWMRTSSKAEGKAEFHDNCTCKVVASKDCKVEGYDPDLLLERYRKCRNAITWKDVNGKTALRNEWERLGEPGKYSDFKTDRVLKEMATRDRAWLNGGNCSADYSRLTEAQYDSLAPHEKETYDNLASEHGLPYTVLEADPTAKANIDALYRGSLWELKNPGSGKHSMEDRIRDAVAKWRKLGKIGKPKLIICNNRSNRDNRDALEEAIRRCKWYGVGELLFLSRDYSFLVRTKF